MSRWMWKMAAGATALAIVGGATACSDDASEKPGSGVCLADGADALAVVVAGHGGAVSGLPAEVACAIDEAADERIPVSVVVSEGNPRLVVSQEVFEPTKKEASNIRDQRDAWVSGLYDGVGQVAAAPSADGNDSYQALALAMDAVSGAKSPQVIVTDSLLSDTGKVDMAVPGMLNSDPDHLIDLTALNRSDGKNSCLPSTGVHVDLVGPGQGVAPQPQLTPDDRNLVAGLWSGLLTQCGADVSVHPSPLKDTGVDPSSSGKSVKSIEPSGYEDPRPEAPETFPASSPLGFEDGSAAFRDTSAADELLDQYAEELTRHARWAVTIDGYTASGKDDAELRELSQKRAEAVRDGLVERGVDASRVSAVGHGYVADPAVTDEATAAQNRKIVITFHE